MATGRTKYRYLITYIQFIEFATLNQNKFNVIIIILVLVKLTISIYHKFKIIFFIYFILYTFLYNYIILFANSTQTRLVGLIIFSEEINKYSNYVGNNDLLPLIYDNIEYINGNLFSTNWPHWSLFILLYFEYTHYLKAAIVYTLLYTWVSMLKTIRFIICETIIIKIILVVVFESFAGSSRLYIAIFRLGALLCYSWALWLSMCASLSHLILLLSASRLIQPSGKLTS